MSRKTVYVCGNLLVDEDSLPLRIMPALAKTSPDYDFREFEPTENFPEEDFMVIIDTVVGIDSVSIIDDIENIETGKVYSLHDFDLGFNLKLMKKLDKIKEVRIIGIPAGMDEKAAIEGVASALKSLYYS